ncbi:sigma-54-dependent transcriptional regulator [Devosia sp. XGJD_8]|uniref:sigma-54-dependent transcriptional regulator n=1 Tax=Devosia sp. XGJD_8 TaxID=3391187 RepID=UPI00398499D9
MTRGRIAFIDDEKQLCEAAEDWLSVSGFTVATYQNPAQAMREIDPHAFDCVVSDLRMPGASGFDVLTHFRAADRDLPVILLTGHGDVPVAVRAIQTGAYDFIEKPYDADMLVTVLDRAVERRRLRIEIDRLHDGAGAPSIEDRLIGISPAIVALRSSVAQLASINVDILITGQTGTGKEVLARALHEFGARSAGNFVAINCAAVPESIFESEIFGHEKGAFSGAVAERAGKFEYGQGGTVFLDEIESMPLALQAKVLRAIQERTVVRLGSNRERPIDVRFIAATKTDLRRESEAGRFRSDLYYRLATVELALPPLAERREDIPLLYGVFARAAAERFGMALPQDMDLTGLGDQPWPGNVRELKSAAERAVLGLASPASPRRSRGQAGTLPDRVARFEAEAIAQTLRMTNGSTAEAAEQLGLPRRTLNEKIARYGLRGADSEAVEG